MHYGRIPVSVVVLNSISMRQSLSLRGGSQRFPNFSSRTREKTKHFKWCPYDISSRFSAISAPSSFLVGKKVVTIPKKEVWHVGVGWGGLSWQPSTTEVRMTRFRTHASAFSHDLRRTNLKHTSAGALIFLPLKHLFFSFNSGVTMPGLDCVTLTRGSGAKDTAHCRNRRNGRRKVGRVNQLYCSLDYTDIWSVEPDTDRRSTLHSRQAPSPWLTLHHDAFLTLGLPIRRVF